MKQVSDVWRVVLVHIGDALDTLLLDEEDR